MIISKELLSEVLEIKIDKIINNSRRCKPNTIVYDNEELNDYEVINIYELAHKCKEWASIKSYYISSCINSDNTIDPVCSKYNAWVNQFVFDGEPIEITVGCFGADTDPEAIFKACEWILKQKADNALR